MKDTNKTFTITCTMNEKWIPQFLGVLRRMQILGEMRSSRNITLFSAGDRDFRPKFEWNTELPIPDSPTKQSDGDTIFNAG